MKALLLAAGFGKRLGELTKNKPKPLIEVGGKPIIEFCLEQLAYSGVTEVIVNTHYLSQQINDFLLNYKTSIKITISFESSLLGTAGTLKKHIDYLAMDDFFVMHSDNYFQSSLKEFAHFHNQRLVGKYGSLATFTTSDPNNCGIVKLNQDKTIAEYYEKDLHAVGNTANAAIYIFTPKIKGVVESLSEQENDISKHLIPLIFPELVTYHFEGLFVDIGTTAGLKSAHDHYCEVKRSITD